MRLNTISDRFLLLLILDDCDFIRSVYYAITNEKILT